MNATAQHIVLLVYNSYKDPLCSGFFLSYFKGLAGARTQFHLITFEQEAYKMDEEEIKSVKRELLLHHIHWYPCRYRSGKLILVKKMVNLCSAFRKLAWLKYKWNSKIIFSLANVAGVLAYVSSRILLMKNCIVSFEPHAQFLADFGRWKQSGLKYKLLNALEQRAGLRSEFIITGTSYMRDKLLLNARGKIFRAPSAVNENIFGFTAAGRVQKRKLLGIDEGQPVIIYAGKFGGLYGSEEIPEFISRLQGTIKGLFFLIITQQDHTSVRTVVGNSMAEECYRIASARSPVEMAEWYSAADFGLSGVPALPNQKFRSPVKVGEYLMCGLPFITCRGVSEDDTVAQQENVGVVIESFSVVDVSSTCQEVIKLLSEDKTGLRSRCRKAGIAYRGLNNVVPILQQIIATA